MLEFALGLTMGQKGTARSASLARSMAVGDAGHHANMIEDLNERVDRMLLIMQAMWALLEEQGLTEDQLMVKIEEIDAADGATDGRRRALPSDCSNCGSKVAAGLPACQICGSPVSGPISGPLDQL